VGAQAKDIVFGSESIPVVIPRHLVQDIDTPEDWERAEKLYKILYQTSIVTPSSKRKGSD